MKLCENVKLTFSFSISQRTSLSTKFVHIVKTDELFSTTKTWLLVSITKVWYYSGPFLWHHPHLNIQHIWADVTMCVLMTPSAAQAPNYGISSKCWDVSVDDRPNLHVPGTGYKTDGNLIDDVTNVTLGAVPHAQVHNLNAKSSYSTQGKLPDRFNWTQRKLHRTKRCRGAKVVEIPGRNVQSCAVITRSNIRGYCIHHCKSLQSLGQNIIRAWIHKRHPIPRPSVRAMGCLLWWFRRKLTAL